MSGKKKILCKFFIVLNLFMSVHAFAMGSYFSVNSLRDFSKQLPQTQDLIQNALSIANRHLRYEFGSADPRNGGLDCSGTIYYLLRTYHLRDVPRQSDEIYQWVWNKGKFYAVNGHHFNSFEFSRLKPGDLLFWSGTYHVHRDPPITHIMLYLGRDKNNQPLMFGASDGRTYRGEMKWGVTVFDFELPSENSPIRFLGYGCIPNFNC